MSYWLMNLPREEIVSRLEGALAEIARLRTLLDRCEGGGGDSDDYPRNHHTDHPFDRADGDLEAHLNAQHQHRLTDLMGMSWDEKNDLHYIDHLGGGR